MTNIQEILDNSGANLVKKLKSQFDDLKLNDTGKAKASLSHKVVGYRLDIEGLLRAIVMVTGRKPGKPPPFHKIRKWVESKLGLTGAEADTAAFLIARKISKKGTDIFMKKAWGLQIQLAIDELNEDIHKEVSNELSLRIGSLISDSYK